MQTREMAAALMALAVFANSPTVAQDRDSRQTGSSELSGRVVAGATGTPVRRAVVRIYPPSGIEAAATLTDSDGRFEFKQLPSGRYEVIASKAGYLRSSFGQPGPGRHGRHVAIGPGQNVRDVGITLSAAGAIAGRIADEFGDPVVRGRVEVVRVSYEDGERRLSTTGSDATNNHGEFRVFGLSPGDYFVRARVEPEHGRAESADRTAGAPTYYPERPASAKRIA